MLFKVVCLLLVGSVFADGPSNPPSGPVRAFYVLPSQYTLSESQKAANLEELSQKIMEHLRQQQGSNTGVYHVFQPDGKLQKVQYTTAPISKGSTPPQSDYSQGSSSSQRFGGFGTSSEQLNNVQEPNPVLAHFGRYQYESAQLQQQQQRQQYQPQPSNNYIASVRYTEVDPIKPPVYSYKPAPLARVLRYAPQV